MPKLTEETKKSIKDSLMIWAGPLREGADPAHILDQCARYTIGLLELQAEVLKTFYEEKEE